MGARWLIYCALILFLLRVLSKHPQIQCIVIVPLPQVVVFTNQGGIRTGKVKVADYTHKIEAIAAKLGGNVPLQLFAVTGEGNFRKPRVGLWNLLAERFNGSVGIDMGEINRGLFNLIMISFN